MSVCVRYRDSCYIPGIYVQSEAVWSFFCRLFKTHIVWNSLKTFCSGDMAKTQLNSVQSISEHLSPGSGHPVGFGVDQHVQQRLWRNRLVEHWHIINSLKETRQVIMGQIVC